VCWAWGVIGGGWRLVPFGIVGQLIIFLDTSSFLFVVLESCQNNMLSQWIFLFFLRSALDISVFLRSAQLILFFLNQVNNVLTWIFLFFLGLQWTAALMSHQS
jgi:hypothetical protein